MERYDGKTKRDDYIKYGLIAAGVLLLILGYVLLTGYLKRTYQKEPDYRVVLCSEEAFGEQVTKDLQNMLQKLVGDRNGDGTELVELKVLRVTDYGQAKMDAELAMEEYMDAQAQGVEASLRENFSGLSMDDDANRMLLYMTTGEYDLFILSDQPRGGFRGAATTYCEAGYFAELPEDIQSEAGSDRCDISDAPFWKQLGYEDIPFYACVLDSGDAAAEKEAIELIRQLKTSGITLW